MKPYRQTTPYTVEQYVNAGCRQMVRDGLPDIIGLGLHGYTRGMMCNGCPEMRNRCPALARLANEPLHISRPAQVGETVRQEAERRGISISEVRRQRMVQHEA